MHVAATTTAAEEAVDSIENAEELERAWPDSVSSSYSKSARPVSAAHLGPIVVGRLPQVFPERTYSHLRMAVPVAVYSLAEVAGPMP